MKQFGHLLACLAFMIVGCSQQPASTSSPSPAATVAGVGSSPAPQQAFDFYGTWNFDFKTLKITPRDSHSTPEDVSRDSQDMSQRFDKASLQIKPDGTWINNNSYKDETGPYKEANGKLEFEVKPGDSLVITPGRDANWIHFHFDRMSISIDIDLHKA